MNLIFLSDTAKHSTSVRERFESNDGNEVRTTRAGLDSDQLRNVRSTPESPSRQPYFENADLENGKISLMSYRIT